LQVFYSNSPISDSPVYGEEPTGSEELFYKNTNRFSSVK
jgi:hypothetical protein